MLDFCISLKSGDHFFASSWTGFLKESYGQDLMYWLEKCWVSELIQNDDFILFRQVQNNLMPALVDNHFILDCLKIGIFALCK